MEAVGVLLRQDGVEDDLAVDLLGERELDQDSVDPRIAIDLVDQRQQVVLAGRGRQPVVRHIDPHRLAGFLFILDVQVRGRIVADQDRRQARFDAAPRQKRRGVLGDLVPDRL